MKKSAFWQQCQWMKLRLDWTTLFFFPPSSIFFYLSSSPPFLCLIWFWCFFSFFLLSVHHLLCSFSIPPLQREGSTSGPNSGQDLVLMGRVGESSECGQREWDMCQQISLSQRTRVLLQWESVCQGHWGYLSFYGYWSPFFCTLHGCYIYMYKCILSKLWFCSRSSLWVMWPH